MPGPSEIEGRPLYADVAAALAYFWAIEWMIGMKGRLGAKCRILSTRA